MGVKLKGSVGLEQLSLEVCCPNPLSLRDGSSFEELSEALFLCLALVASPGLCYMVCLD